MWSEVRRLFGAPRTGYLCLFPSRRASRGTTAEGCAPVERPPRSNTWSNSTKLLEVLIVDSPLHCPSSCSFVQLSRTLTARQTICHYVLSFLRFPAILTPSPRSISCRLRQLLRFFFLQPKSPARERYRRGHSNSPHRQHPRRFHLPLHRHRHRLFQHIGLLVRQLHSRRFFYPRHY